jgi:hypothetical protein
MRRLNISSFFLVYGGHLSLKIEQEIRALLNDYIDPSLVAEQLRKKYRGERLSTEEARAIVQFFFKAHLYNDLVLFITDSLLHRNNNLPWDLFAETMGLTEGKVTQSLWEAFEKGAEEQNQSLILSMSHFSRKKNNKYRQLNQIRINELYQKIQAKKAEMFSDLATLRTQGMIEAEKEYLKKMQATFPGDPDVLRDFENQKERMAREVFDRYRSHKSIDPAPPLTTDEIDFLKSYVEKTKDQWIKRIDLSYEMAVALFMFESYEQVIEICLKLPSHPSRDWLLAEAYLQNKKYLELLEWLPELEIKYANDSELFFASSYLRSQALWGLGQQALALELIEALLLQRPDYRAANTLLAEWRTS